MKKKGLNSKAIFMKRKIFGLLLVAIVGVFVSYNVYQTQKKVGSISDLAMANIEALASSREVYMGAGTCWGAGPHMSNVTCYGGYVICCWAHTDIFGKN
ncbi:NVEALA domain-containing protein [Bacteroides congonensis]